MIVYEARKLLETITAFETATEGDSGDIELDAAQEMKAAALAFLRKVSEQDIQLAELIDEFDEKNDPIWSDNSIQFPRLLAEVYGVIDDEMIQEIADSMDLPSTKVRELFQRADDEFEKLKLGASMS